MLTTLAITGPIYLVIALGFLAVRFDIFSRIDMRVLGTFVVKFALPALVFTSLSQRRVNDILNARYLIDYASVPMLSIYPILAQEYNFESFCAAALLLTTVLSFATISGVLWLLGSALGWIP